MIHGASNLNGSGLFSFAIPVHSTQFKVLTPLCEPSDESSRLSVF
jgi:hypothetical protein